MNRDFILQAIDDCDQRIAKIQASKRSWIRGLLPKLPHYQEAGTIIKANGSYPTVEVGEPEWCCIVSCSPNHNYTAIDRWNVYVISVDENCFVGTAEIDRENFDQYDIVGHGQAVQTRMMEWLGSWKEASDGMKED